MASLTEVFNAGAANAWVFAPSAIMLGALHGLEPGHSKTMMAAFIVAIRGTVTQAILLGLAATVSHSAIVWLIAFAGLYLGSRWTGEAAEPYLQIASGALIIAVAGWMAWRNRRQNAAAHAGHDHGHAQDHAHELRRHDHAHGRPHGESPHGESHRHGHHGQHRHHGHHGHRHQHAAPARRDAAAFEHDLALVEPSAEADAHERAHALDINRRFGRREVTTGQIILFGLTGGLIPCPASITVLLLCLQVGRVALGAALVLCFSIGLALTLVLVGVGAALGIRHAASRWPVVDAIAARAPYLSGAIIMVVGLYTIYLGVAGLA